MGHCHCKFPDLCPEDPRQLPWTKRGLKFLANCGYATVKNSNRSWLPRCNPTWAKPIPPRKNLRPERAKHHRVMPQGQAGCFDTGTVNMLYIAPIAASLCLQT